MADGILQNLNPMKIITPIVFAGAALAFCGCSSADGPIFATPATKAAPTAAGQPAQEQARDIQDWQNSGQNMGVSQGTNGAPAQSMNQANPYAH
jgi:hypothetical protein